MNWRTIRYLVNHDRQQLRRGQRRIDDRPRHPANLDKVGSFLADTCGWFPKRCTNNLKELNQRFIP